MNLLVVYENREMRDLVSFFLEGRFKVNVIEAESADHALFLLNDKKHELDGLVCSYPGEAKKLLSHILATGIDIHFFCSSEGIPDDPMVMRRKSWVHFFPEASVIHGLETQMKSVFKELRKDLDLKQLSFSRIKFSLLLRTSPLKGNLYERLSDHKYIRSMKAGFDFDWVDYEYFSKRKKIEILYIETRLCTDVAVQIEKHLRDKVSVKKPLDAFIDENSNENDVEAKKKKIEYLKSRILALEQQKGEVIDLDQQQSCPPDEKLEISCNPEVEKRTAMIQAKAQEILEQKKQLQHLIETQNALRAKELEQQQKKREVEIKRLALLMHLEKELCSDLENVSQMSNRLGFNKEVQEFTKQSVMEAIQTVRKIPKLAALLMNLRKEKDKYIFSHSMLLAYVSCAIASQMDWKSDTTYQKLTFASFLHDMVLKNHELAAIQSMSELLERAAEFTPEEQQAYKDHPRVGAELVRRIHEIPPDVDMIIEQHHERPDGSGFPKALSHARITALATVFIVSHDLVSFIFKGDKLNASGVDLNQFLTEYHQTYQFGNFRKVLAIVPKVGSESV
jgi:HD-GYP domain-containing protein (c-di-GMP phosphodiesterase class II)